MNLAIAIDGPAGAGKSTIAKRVARKLNIMYLNTGLMYRAVTYKALKENIKPEQLEKLCAAVDAMEMYFDNYDIIVDGMLLTPELTTPEISKNVSAYACLAEIRKRMVKLQQELSKKYDVIMDGRDIGTVVLKDAPFKFFLTASAEERAKRRYIELKSKNIEVDYDQVLKDIIHRDYLDTTREVDPLVKAEDAIEIDTTSLRIDEIVDIILNHINK
ncbi:(d)CMP kinase [Clostridium oryzae]|uniref:Cytidylate kinase n=1 Tax=Clostridium oryzae TaxID=1450648 RepID=A0A1V4ICZ1_9CLOT|nr:(d)CMP kinase [Clostridium oryzae]OPJ57387.1 cytidylate kinase [Clostridium oryzae]